MPIKFKCPHCEKPLAVKEHLAGKRAACPACKKVITIPAPTAAAADVEALAASALADETSAAAAKKPASTIDFTCVFCDAELHLATDLGGKQTPCPECRRIIKVPLPAKNDNTDWRALQYRGPSGARQAVEQPVPEGVWGSTTRPGAVSREALEEAGVLVEKAEPLTVAQWIRRGVLAASLVVVLIVGWTFLKKLWTHNLEEEALAQALAQVESLKAKLPPEWAAEVYRGSGEFHLLANQATEARAAFRKARAFAQNASASVFDRDAFLIELALTQLDLGGTAQLADAGQRLDWGDAAKEVHQTLVLIQTPEARHEGVRRVCLKLSAQGLETYVGAIKGLDELAGTEVVPAHKKPLLAALLLALLQPENAKSLLPAPADDKALAETDLATRALHESGWTRSRQLRQVRDFLVKAPKDPVADRLDCLRVVAAVAWQQDQRDEAKRCVDEAVKLIATAPRDPVLPPWLLADWALLAVQTNQNNHAGTLVKLLESQPELKGRIHLEQYRLTAGDKGELSPDSWSKAVPESKTLAHARALEVYARHKARQGAGSETLQAIREMNPETVRPLGYVGIALGVQDRKR